MVSEGIKPKSSDSLRIHTVIVALNEGDKYKIIEECEVTWLSGGFTTVSHDGCPLPAESGNHVDGAVIIVGAGGCRVRVTRYFRTPKQ